MRANHARNTFANIIRHCGTEPTVRRSAHAKKKQTTCFTPSHKFPPLFLLLWLFFFLFYPLYIPVVCIFYAARRTNGCASRTVSCARDTMRIYSTAIHPSNGIYYLLLRVSTVNYSRYIGYIFRDILYMCVTEVQQILAENKT